MSAGGLLSTLHTKIETVHCWNTPIIIGCVTRPCLSVCRLVGWSVCHNSLSVIISLKGAKFHLHAAIGPLVNTASTGWAFIWYLPREIYSPSLLMYKRSRISIFALSRKLQVSDCSVNEMDGERLREKGRESYLIIVATVLGIYLY